MVSASFTSSPTLLAIRFPNLEQQSSYLRLFLVEPNSRELWMKNFMNIYIPQSRIHKWFPCSQGWRALCFAYIILLGNTDCCSFFQGACSRWCADSTLPLRRNHPVLIIFFQPPLLQVGRSSLRQHYLPSGYILSRMFLLKKTSSKHLKGLMEKMTYTHAYKLADDSNVGANLFAT